ncbi:MAG: hypothetical protein WBX00_19180 [Isosphaeraceae bacterium]
MRKTPYYSVRTGKNQLSQSFGLATMRDLFKTLFVDFEDKGYFQEAFGYQCVDAGFVPGTLGQNLAGALLLALRKDNLTPIGLRIDNYAEDDLFDVIEFLYEHCSRPIKEDGYHHTFSQCGWHFNSFERDPGRREYRERINELLALYESGYELSDDGELLTLADDGLGDLFDAELPEIDPENINGRVAAAKTKFRRYRSSLDERRDAVRDLADVLEYLKPRAHAVLDSADESDLFHLANKFGIRHHNSNQKTSYSKPIWYSWMFYYYLATIHAVVRLIKEAEKAEVKGG